MLFKIVKIIFVIFLTLQPVSAFALDEAASSTVGITGGPVYAIAVASDSTESVYVATGEGLFKSEYGKTIWIPANTGLNSTFVYDIVIDPITPTILYSTTKEGVYTSTDSGENWSSLGLESYQIFALAIQPVSVTYLAAGTGIGVFTTSDGGEKWTNEATGPSDVYDLTVDPKTQTTMYAGSYGNGIYRSTDFGETWSKAATGPDFVHCVEINPFYTNVLYAGTFSGIYKSVDSGVTWSLLTSQFSDVPVYSIAIDPIAFDTLYAATDKGVYRTVNAGSSWESTNTGISADATQGPFVREIVIDQDLTSTLYAGTYSGDNFDADIYKSTDGGTSWLQINRDLSNTTVNSITFDATDPDIVYAGTSTIGILKSSNSGISFHEANKGLWQYLIRSIAVNPDSSTIYAGTPVGLFISSNAAAAWTQASPNYDIYSIAVDPHSSQNVYIGTNRGIFMSADEGENWTSLNNQLGNPYVYSIVFHPDESEFLYVGTNGDGIFRSTTGGEKWESINAGIDYLEVLCLAIDPTNPYTLYAGTIDGGMFKSTDGGDIWNITGPDIINPTTNSIVINPYDSDTVYAGMENRGLYRTTDGGQSWDVADEEIFDKTVYDLALDPEDSQTVLMALDGEIRFVTINRPPSPPDSPSPLDGAINQSIETTLSWEATDPDAGDNLTYEVYFGIDDNPYTNTPVETATAEYDPGVLQISQTYYWKVTATDFHGLETEGPTWSFATIMSNPPLVPSSPAPQDGSEDQPTNIALQWSGGDTDDGDVVTYDLFLGTQEIPPLAAEGLTDTQYQPKRRLKARRTYYWKIVAKDNTGLETEGAIWQFTTGFLPEIPEECMIELALGKDDPRLSELRRFRDEILHQTEEGRRLTEYYYHMTPSLLKLFQHDQNFQKASIKLFEELYPSIEKSLRTGKFILPPPLFQRMQNLFDLFIIKAYPQEKN